MFLGLHVATVMFAVALAGATLYLGQPAVFAFGTQLWAATEDFVLLSIPLYICSGDPRPRRSRRQDVPLARGLAELAAGAGCCTNIGASAMFSAISGSSVATARPSRPSRCPPSRRAATTSASCSARSRPEASLGNLISPGIAFIVYGAMTNTSAGRLYAAGVIPA
jgi:TRAP-type C4-dicarboxylate transport system permease large subunit